MLQCGSINDVYSYKKMKRPPSSLQDDSPPSSPPPTSLAKPRAHKKSMSFSISAPVSPTSAKLDAKKTMSFRWIGWHSAAGTSSSDKRASSGDVKASTMAPSSSGAATGLPPKKQKRIGFIDILLGYHSLLQASPAYPTSAQRRELYPTIGFIRNPEYGAQP